MNVEKTALDGVLLIEPPTIFQDHRGEFVETYNRDIYVNAGIDHDFRQDDISLSHHNVLRGIHGDDVTWKLVSCLVGELFLAVINWDESSGQYRQWTSFTLSETQRRQVLIPPKFGNGHYVLSERAIFQYKQTTDYDRGKQFSLGWNDPELGIAWPATDPILSQRDREMAAR